MLDNNRLLLCQQKAIVNKQYLGDILTKEGFANSSPGSYTTAQGGQLNRARAVSTKLVFPRDHTIHSNSQRLSPLKSY